VATLPFRGGPPGPGTAGGIIRGGPDKPSRLPGVGGPAGGKPNLDPLAEANQQTFDAEGMRIILQPIPFLTEKGLLPTPDGVVLQCPPLDQFAVAYSHSHNDYETFKRQQSRAGVPQLATISFDTLVVDWGTYAVNQRAVTEERTLKDTTNRLKRLCLSGTPFQLIATHVHHPQKAKNLHKHAEWFGNVTLRQFTVTEKAGEGDARYLNVAFTEYREATQPKKGKGRPGSAAPPTKVKLYWDGHATDEKGNRLANPPQRPVTLAFLAKHFYKKPELAHRLGQANKLGNWGANDPLINHPRWKHLKRNKFHIIKIPRKSHLPGKHIEGSRAQYGGRD
jgi:hypothetical protein